MREIRAFFAKRHVDGVVAAYLFGSVARGTAHAESDVDIALLLDWTLLPTRAERFDVRLRVAAALDARLAVRAGEFPPAAGLVPHVDVLVLNDTPPVAARDMLLHAVPLFVADAAAARDFLRDIQLRAADLEPFLRKHRRTTLEALLR